MVKGVGVDIVSNARFSSLSDSFLERVFTPSEIHDANERKEREEFLASRFAVKEAVAKALGTGFVGISPRDIETREDEKGRPYVVIKGKRDERFHISLSHESNESIAFAVLEEV